MAQITLASIRAAADAKYGSFDVILDEHNTVSLLHPIRLSKEKRAELTSVADVPEGEDEADIEDRLVGIIRAVTSETGATKLLEAISPEGHPDLAILSDVVSGYMESQKVGEASASQD